jgi:ketosteroid isomerase-like protein
MANDSNWLGSQNLKFEKSDFNIKVFPDCAWTTYNETFTGIYQNEPIKTESIHLTVLEKTEGQWKIAAFVAVDKTGYETAVAAAKEETAEN